MHETSLRLSLGGEIMLFNFFITFSDFLSFLQFCISILLLQRAGGGYS